MFVGIAVLISFMVVSLYTAGLRANGVDLYILGKAACSAVFIATGVYSLLKNRFRSNYCRLVFIGLFFGFIGDMLLAFDVGRDGNLLFILGMVAFFINHILYILAFFTLDRFKWRDVFISAVIFSLLAWFIIAKSQSIGNMLVPLLIYMAVMSFTSSKAISVALSKKAGETATILFCTGALLWAFSDVALGIDMYIDDASVLRGIAKSLHATSEGWLGFSNAFSYFIGQTLMACSIMYHRIRERKPQ